MPIFGCGFTLGSFIRRYCRPAATQRRQRGDEVAVCVCQIWVKKNSHSQKRNGAHVGDFRRAENERTAARRVERNKLIRMQTRFRVFRARFAACSAGRVN
jgi:hypothetical protein